jgi:hypothetical protein
MHQKQPPAKVATLEACPAAKLRGAANPSATKAAQTQFLRFMVSP